MLWVGWHGFNAGSAVAADGVLLPTLSRRRPWRRRWLLHVALIEFFHKENPACWGSAPARWRGCGHHSGLRFLRTAGSAVIIGILVALFLISPSPTSARFRV
ncbi:MAG: hypothetical protein U1F57_05815 [bacterium]